MNRIPPAQGWGVEGGGSMQVQGGGTGGRGTMGRVNAYGGGIRDLGACIHGGADRWRVHANMCVCRQGVGVQVAGVVKGLPPWARNRTA